MDLGVTNQSTFTSAPILQLATRLKFLKIAIVRRTAKNSRKTLKITCGCVGNFVGNLVRSSCLEVSSSTFKLQMEDESK